MEEEGESPNIDWMGETEAMRMLLQAIEEREATAQTIVDEGFAMPHAIIDWDGDYRVVLGRSRTGVDYGIPESPRVYLIALLLVGTAVYLGFAGDASTGPGRSGLRIWLAAIAGRIAPT